MRRREILKKFFKQDLVKVLYDREKWIRAEKFEETEIVICAYCNKEIQDKRPFIYFPFWTPKDDYFLHLHYRCAFTEKVNSEYYKLNDYYYKFAIIGGIS